MEEEECDLDGSQGSHAIQAHKKNFRGSSQL